MTSVVVYCWLQTEISGRRSDYSGLFSSRSGLLTYTLKNATCFNHFNVLWLTEGKEGDGDVKTKTTEVILLRHSPHDSHTVFWCNPSRGQSHSVSAGRSLFLEPRHVPTSTIHKPLKPKSLWEEKYNRPQARRFSGRYLKTFNCVERQRGGESLSANITLTSHTFWTLNGICAGESILL